MKIPGGYILQPRCIDNSFIAGAPPHVREIWSYLLRKANHQPRKASGKLLDRGQLWTSYSQIISDLSWKVGYRKESYKRHHIETAMKLLTAHTMIATTKTTRGMIVTICKYDYYQNPRNYETDSETDSETDNEPTGINKKEKNYKNIEGVPPPPSEGKKKRFTPPSLDEVKAYATTRGRSDLSKSFFDYYDAGDWKDKDGKPVKNWKQKFISWENWSPKAETQERKIEFLN